MLGSPGPGTKEQDRVPCLGTQTWVGVWGEVGQVGPQLPGLRPGASSSSCLEQGPPPRGRPSFPRGSQAPSPSVVFGPQEKAPPTGCGSGRFRGPSTAGLEVAGAKERAAACLAQGFVSAVKVASSSTVPGAPQNAVLNEPFGAKEHDGPQRRSQLQWGLTSGPLPLTQTDQFSQLLTLL